MPDTPTPPTKTVPPAMAGLPPELQAAGAQPPRPIPPSSAQARSYIYRVTALGLYHAVIAVLLVAQIYALWPEQMKDSDTQATFWSAGYLLGSSVPVGNEARLILIVLCTGALGSYLHSATSFVSYVGNRRLVFSWALWYVLRPFIGMALALIFYFVLRGGLMATSAPPDQISPFGIAAVAGLVGMFSKQAADKLREIFDNLFRTESGHGDDARVDKLGANRPVAAGMLERAKIVAFTILEGQAEEQVKIAALHQLLNGVVTRIPVLDHTGAARCVIHQSLLYKFLADRSIDAARTGVAFDVNAFTLKDLLDAPGMRDLVANSLGFVPAGATIAEAKRVMEETKNCQDIFVTERGSRDEPIQGWLTNGEILRLARV